MVQGQGDRFSEAGQALNSVPGSHDSEARAVSPHCLNSAGSGVTAGRTEARAEDSGEGPGGEESGDIDPGGEERTPGMKVVPSVYQPTKEELE